MSATRTLDLTVASLIVASTSVTALAGGDTDEGGASRGLGVLLHDNGPPDDENGYSNTSRHAFIWQRTLLDDFVIEGFGGVAVTGLRHYATWSTLPPGSGLGMLAWIRVDDEGAPGDIIAELDVSGYEEIATGRIVFNRPEYEAWTEFEPCLLFPGRYWFEATVIGPEGENNFWLTRDAVRYSECWVNYDDIGGFQPGGLIFDQARDLAWSLYGDASGASAGCCMPDASCVNVDSSEECELLGGTYQGPFVFCNEVECACTADLDGDGSVAFQDVLAVLAAWGPCEGDCPADVDASGAVDFGDLLILLSAWGPCA